MRRALGIRGPQHTNLLHATTSALHSPCARSPHQVGGVVAAAAGDASTGNAGTADAVRQHLGYLLDPLHPERSQRKYCVIAGGDQLYSLNFAHVIQHHERQQAAVTVVVTPCDAAAARGFGLVRLADDGNIEEFVEKPTGDLAHLVVDTGHHFGLGPEAARAKQHAASTGIYVMNATVLQDLLLRKMPGATDFGAEVLPGAIELGHTVTAYAMAGFWQDVGTLPAFYQAHQDLLHRRVALDLRGPGAMQAQQRHLPPTCARVRSGLVELHALCRVVRAQRQQLGLAISSCFGTALAQQPLAAHSHAASHGRQWLQGKQRYIGPNLISDGCDIGPDCTLQGSILGLSSVLSNQVTAIDSILMGTDHSEFQQDWEETVGKPSGLGSGTCALPLPLLFLFACNACGLPSTVHCACRTAPAWQHATMRSLHVRCCSRCRPAMSSAFAGDVP